LRVEKGAMMSRDLFDSYTKAFESRRETVMTIQEYLEGCKKTR
jgi:predicted Ser/Thr protein kinase